MDDVKDDQLEEWDQDMHVDELLQAAGNLKTKQRSITADSDDDVGLIGGEIEMGEFNENKSDPSTLL